MRNRLLCRSKIATFRLPAVVISDARVDGDVLAGNDSGEASALSGAVLLNAHISRFQRIFCEDDTVLLLVPHATFLLTRRGITFDAARFSFRIETYLLYARCSCKSGLALLYTRSGSFVYGASYASLDAARSRFDTNPEMVFPLKNFNFTSLPAMTPPLAVVASPT